MFTNRNLDRTLMCRGVNADIEQVFKNYTNRLQNNPIYFLL